MFFYLHMCTKCAQFVLAPGDDVAKCVHLKNTSKWPLLHVWKSIQIFLEELPPNIEKHKYACFDLNLHLYPQDRYIRCFDPKNHKNTPKTPLNLCVRRQRARRENFKKHLNFDPRVLTPSRAWLTVIFARTAISRCPQPTSKWGEKWLIFDPHGLRILYTLCTFCANCVHNFFDPHFWGSPKGTLGVSKLTML
jgi:hypothetical protein